MMTIYLILLFFIHIYFVESYSRINHRINHQILRFSSNVNIDTNTNILCQFLEDAKCLRGVRHVVQGTGAILETAGSFENLRYSDIPGKGILATVSSDIPLFECHIRIYEIREVKLLEIIKFEKKLYVIRFLLESGSTALSSILMNTDDANEIDKWNALKLKYGNEFKVVI